MSTPYRDIPALLFARKAFEGNSMRAVHVGPQQIMSRGRLNEQDYKVLLHDLADEGGYVVYSYGTPIAWRTEAGAVITKQKFSRTTGRHLNLCHANL